MANRSPNWRLWLLFAIALATCIGLIAYGPIVQDQAYHSFADERGMFGVPNAWNVLSNLPFLLLGAWGLLALLRDRGLGAPLRAPYFVFFIGSALVALGSAYYHAAPSDAALVWDRLPMTLAFMAFFAAIVSHHVAPTFARRMLVPLLLLGLSTVLWWKFRGDLRPYLLVQFLPILLIPAILLLYPSKSHRTKYIWWVLAVYVLAKALEIYDVAIYEVLGFSGHSLKHIAAAVAVYFVLQSLRTVREA